MTTVQITKIPSLNSVVIRQKGGHFFIAAPDSIIIDKDGFLKLIEALGNIGFFSWQELEQIGDTVYENTKDSGSSSIG